ncbi:MAG TPA: acyltransferase [Pirellulales bacterium]|nr:acyltransferase [Pirellulales bacterium]
MKTPRIEILDPLRGLAALAVAWFHFTTCNAFLQSAWLKASGTYGWLGVDVFFVISGFVIPYSMYAGGYHPRQHFVRFLGKRLARLEPPYLMSLILVISLAYLKPLVFPETAESKPPFSVPQLLLHLGYLNTFFDYEWLTPVYWTLGIEFQYYLFVALVYPLLASRRAILGPLSVLALASLALLVKSPIFVFHFLGLFAFGILAFQYHVRLLPRKAFLAAILLVSAITAASLTWVIAVVGGVTALVIAFVPMPRSSALKVFVYFGTISYSIYLLHTIIGGPVVHIGSRFGSGPAWEVAILTAAIGASLLAAMVFHQLVERPAQGLSSRIKYSAWSAAALRTSLDSGKPATIGTGQQSELRVGSVNCG